MTPRSAVILTFAALLTLSGCTREDTKWTHAEVPPEHWSVDAAQCRHDAMRKAENDFFRDGGSSTSDMAGTEDMNLLMDQSAVRKRARTLFRSCMLGLGYVPAE